ncbi:hypothetical protein QEG98_01235 [Myxococcus sp. MxC21-1]|uniref:hypothetical protein n=1 Tax=Myxococcus sp. MxC21-1 TaxID=3041439 RepID=UPI002931F0ED|nr:hypothetical protein [Myxococcus sp. MxC21-1]WNZ62500.1 hypothetical protein QEG98_01235 [Myxococcus sp. MxC21-1]
MMTELDGCTQAVNPGVTGTLRNPVPVADIYSGRNASLPNAQAPRNDGTFESTRPAYRFGGQPGAGRPSDIKSNEQGSGSHVASLGHESVHAGAGPTGSRSARWRPASTPTRPSSTSSRSSRGP